jgi:hypothetical protein
VIAVVWQFQVRPGKQDEFEQVFGDVLLLL